MVHTLPPPFFFRAFRVFRGSTLVFRGSIRGSYSPTFILFSCLSCFSWLPLPLTFVSIRAHSCPFVVHTLSPAFFFRVFRGCPLPLTFVPIRVHSWFILSPLLSFFVPFVFFVVPLLYFVVPFVSIRIHSYPFVSIRIHSYPFVSIRIHSYPFVSIRIHSYPFVVPFVSIRVHSWFILSPCFLFRAFRVFRGSTPVFRGSIRGSELWRRGLSSLPAVGFASSLSGYINRVWTETGGRSDYFGEESPDTTGQEARLKDRVSRGKPAVRIAQQRRDRRHFVSARVKKAG